MHNIRGFIGNMDIIKPFSEKWLSDIIYLKQDLSMFFLTDKLYDNIQELVNSKIDTDYSDYFEYFSSSVYELMVFESHHGKIGYIETDYFGGSGSQSALLIEKGKIIVEPLKTKTKWDENSNGYIHTPEGVEAINSILKELSVNRIKGNDEFDSIGLGNYRRME